MEHICEHCKTAYTITQLHQDTLFCPSCADEIWGEVNSNEGYLYTDSDGNQRHTWDFEESIGE